VGALPQTFAIPASSYDFGGVAQPLNPAVTDTPAIVRVDLAAQTGRVGVSLARPDGGELVSREAVITPQQGKTTVYLHTVPGAGPVSLLLRAAADLFACPEPQVTRCGEEYVGPNQELASFEQVVRHARGMGLTLSAQGRWGVPEIHWSFEQGHGRPYFAYHFGAQVAEVLVDTGTGKVQVSGLWAAHNTGTVIFPQGIQGQVYGGMALGLGYALMERVDYDQGYLQSTNFDEYLIPTAMDVPEIGCSFVEKPFSAGPFGAKNVGEPGMVPTAPAVLNAIAHATGRRVYDLPANLERVLLGHDLRKAGTDRACQLGLGIQSAA
jgi:hypothetical protein